VLGKLTGQYCQIVKKDRVPLVPQPSEDDIVVLKRYYQVLKRSKDYKRRVAWIEKFPRSVALKCSSVAVVEYIGPFPDAVTAHGNAKHSGNEYVCTQLHVKQVLEDLLCH
jgi:hypothetical protein